MGANSRHLNSLLITANVGSIFEDPENTLKQWISQFLQLIQATRPEFIAVHCQEVGGKNYEDSMQHVDSFVKTLLSTGTLTEYSRIKVYLDEDFTAEDKFTALGNMYFIHDSVAHVQIWNFENSSYETVEGMEITTGSIEHIPTKEKMKFPVNYFPDCKWSRKGYLRTRWSINRLKFDLYNIHLFHDASNIAALEQSPSQYCGYRQRAFQYVLDRANNESLEKLPVFMFGDFNFRLDTNQLINKLRETGNLEELRILNKKNGKLSQLQYKSTDNEEVILKVESKGFEHHQHEDVFLQQSDLDVQEFDKEFLAFQHELLEFPISFPPSYPYAEDISDGSRYMRTRCPSWCDRILMNQNAMDIVASDESGVTTFYSTIGQNVCMGDHKPVYLHCALKLPGEKRTVTKSVSAEGKLHIYRSVHVGETTPHINGGVDDNTPLSPPHKRVRRAISINGVTVTEHELPKTSLLRGASFQNEEFLTPSMLDSVGKDFASLAHVINLTGRALKKWKKAVYRFSEDEDSSGAEDADINGNLGGSMRKSPRGRSHPTSRLVDPSPSTN